MFKSSPFWIWFKLFFEKAWTTWGGSGLFWPSVGLSYFSTMSEDREMRVHVFWMHCTSFLSCTIYGPSTWEYCWTPLNIIRLLPLKITPLFAGVKNYALALILGCDLTATGIMFDSWLQITTTSNCKNIIYLTKINSEATTWKWCVVCKLTSHLNCSATVIHTKFTLETNSNDLRKN